MRVIDGGSESARIRVHSDSAEQAATMRVVRDEARENARDRYYVVGLYMG